MFKEERKQYAEDCKNHERPWELWERSGMTFDWEPLDTHLMWIKGIKYRRKQTAFVAKYYSGLNWRNAEHLIGKTVECTDNPDYGWKSGQFKIIKARKNGYHFGINICGQTDFYNYIRTCEEIFKHPTINICGVELPKPETVEPELGTNYWVSPPCTEMCWGCSPSDIDALQSGRVHLTEGRAKAWSDWWQAEVIDKIKG